MTTQGPVEPENPSASHNSEGPEAPNPGILWAAVFIAGMLIFFAVSFWIFPGRDGHRDMTDWVLICILPLLVGITLATFVVLLAGLRGRNSGGGGNSGDAPKPEASPPVDNAPPPFSDWLASEWATNEDRSLSIALDKYIEQFAIKGPGAPDEPKELSINRTKLALLKESLLPDPRWQETPELKEYVEDLEFLLSGYASPPPAGPGQPTPGA